MHRRCPRKSKADVKQRHDASGCGRAVVVGLGGAVVVVGPGGAVVVGPGGAVVGVVGGGVVTLAAAACINASILRSAMAKDTTIGPTKAPVPISRFRVDRLPSSSP